MRCHDHRYLLAALIKLKAVERYVRVARKMTERYISCAFFKSNGLSYRAVSFGETDLCKEVTVNEQTKCSFFSLIVVRNAYIVVCIR